MSCGKLGKEWPPDCVRGTPQQICMSPGCLSSASHNHGLGGREQWGLTKSQQGQIYYSPPNLQAQVPSLAHNIRLSFPSEGFIF